MAFSRIALLALIAATIFAAVGASDSDFEDAGAFNPVPPPPRVENDFSEYELNGQGCGQDRHCIFIDNQCDEHLWVLVHYEQMDGKWGIHGWWKIPAKDKKFIINDAKNAAAFFHAENEDLTMVWGDDDKNWGYKGQLYKFHKEIMPDHQTFFTEKFDCSSYAAKATKDPVLVPFVA